MRIRTFGVLMCAAFLTTGCLKNNYAPKAGATAAVIFGDTCATCHNKEGQGWLIGLLKIAGTTRSAEEIIGKINAGGLIMPAFPNISAADRQALANYLKKG